MTNLEALAEQTAVKLRKMKVGGSKRLLGSQLVCTMRRAVNNPELMAQLERELTAFESASGK